MILNSVGPSVDVAVTALASVRDRSGRHLGNWPAPSAGVPQIARTVMDGESDTPPKAARDFTGRILGEWALDDRAEGVCLVVSELVTNAVCHALRCPQDIPTLWTLQLVLIRHPRRLAVAVTDPSVRPPTIVPRPDELRDGGRGLHVVQALSSAWGWAALPCGGKAVWATFDLMPTPLAKHPPG